MANPGSGNRFVSVNLNKSYGQSSHPNHSNSFNYGSGRARSGGGGGMVVLSRPRSSHKTGPKLSVPPPLNLPSLRKEHERFDSSGSGGGSAGGGIPGAGTRPSSSGLGWSKPSAVVSVERDGVSASDPSLSSDGAGSGFQAVDGVTRGGSSGYMPPSARSCTTGPDVSPPMSMEKATVLRGEDFPSLRATLAAANGSVQKQKDSTHHKQREGLVEGPSSGPREGSHTDMRPQVQSQYSVGNSIRVDGIDDHNSSNSRPLEQGRKQEDYFLGPLTLVRLSPRSDWADDERDTSHGLTDRGREHSFSKTETYWDRDFDLPRSNFLPQKPVQNHFDRWGQRDNDVGKGPSNEVSNADPVNRDVRVPSREGRDGQSWRRPASRDGFASQESINDKSFVGPRPISVNRDAAKESKYVSPQYGGNTRDEHIGGLTMNRDFAAGRRDPGYVQGGRQQWNNPVDSSAGAERNFRDRHGSESNRYKADTLQNSMGPRSSFSASSRGPAGNDHSSNFGRDKRSFSRGEKPYMEDPFMSSDFDVRDPFSGGILGVVKRKKDANKHLDFHDPVRESFEAELERVQKMQEQERQRAIEEQERAMEIARREEEERERLVKEREEHQRRMEEEAREAAWRAEQERVEAIRRAEEQRVAREEEKQRILMEEERRRQAAKQKLQELEERMARRQAETVKTDGAADVQGERMPGVVKERDVSRADDFASWEDGERMVERITNTASSDSSISRPFDMGSRPVSVAEGSFAFTDRGKSFNSWRRDAFENGSSSSFFSSEHENGYQSPRRDTFVGGRAFPRKDFYGGSGYMPTRGYYRGGSAEPQMEDFLHPRGHRWSISGDGDPYGRNIELEAEFHESIGEKFDVDWSQGRGRGCSPFSERLYPNSELEDLYTYGRSRYPARQPRVLPPPSLPSVHRTSFKNESEQARSSTYQDEDMPFNHALGSEPAAMSFQNAQEGHSDKLDIQEHSAQNEDQDLNRSITPGCDSQSSLCVSSAPSSPTQLSHDDLDDSRDSVALSGTAEGHDVCGSESEAVLLKAKDRKGTPSSISVGDDEEWTVENNGLQQQEEYDEDVRYNEEVQDGDDDNAELNREFEGMHLEGKGSPHMRDNVVLGFDQGVEVGMPNDESERSPKIAENAYMGPQVIGGPTENVSFDGSRDRQSPQVVSQHLSTNASCVTVEDSQKTVQDYVSEAINTSRTLNSSDPLSSGDSSSVSVLTAQQSIPPSIGVSSQSSSQSVLPSVAGTQGAAELPVKLQFGLFSGPSLIPSPVPAIQIGSIQMPLQLPPQIGPPLSHMHAPQPPIFQFGQLRYPSPISQGFPPLGPQSVPFVQPTIPSHYPSGRTYGGPVSVQPVQEPSTHSSVKDDALLVPMNSYHIQPPNPMNLRPDAELKETKLMAGKPGSNDMPHQNQADTSNAPVNQVRPESCQQAEIRGHLQNVVRSSKALSNNRTSESRAPGGPSSSHFAANFGDSSGPAAQGPSGNKGRRFAFTSRNPGARSSSLSNEAYRYDANGFQRRRRGTQRFEFRVRQATDAKQSSALPSNCSGSDPKSNYVGSGSGMQPRSGPKKDVLHISSSDQSMTRDSAYGIKEEKPARKEASTSGLDAARRTEGSLKRNIASEDDVEAPLQSGIVRVFKQPGIEAPSDEDDFIEVRSKRQMLNDRREQREKEIKAKSSNMRKAQRKSRAAPQGTTAARNTGRMSASLSAQAAKNIHKDGISKNEVPAAFNNMVSQTLAPIGTPPVNADSHGNAKAQTTKPPQTSSCATTENTVGSDLTFRTQSNALNGVLSSVGSQDNSQNNPSVMTLTQTQLEEAMKPVQFDKDATVGDCTCSVSETGMSSSLLAKEKPLPSATSPISCLLAGEKIQFGAVTSPTILPPSTRALSHNIRTPASSQLDIKISRSVPVPENDCALLFEKEKHSDESCRPLEDSEAEAEAAASAVAVAAISNDEVVGPAIGGCSASISVSKGLRVAAVDAMAAGLPGEQQAVTRSKGDESLSVSLPADLSVETPPISLWPPLPSPHSSSQVPSSFSGGPSSHFPFYDMNPMMGGPVFAFSPHEESAGSQSQTQKSSAPSSGPLGTWQQCHPGVYSFYGPPAGFTAPFISPPGSIPEVQGPPHMVVYNHFAPVGQFGQVGLSYMGSTYIPSGKQPDWKHNPASPAMGGGEGEMNSLNMVPAQRNAPNVPAQVQRATSGSPLLSMASPLPMFEVSPFQSAPDASVHPRWSHLQTSSLHSIPQSMPLQQQPEGPMPVQQLSHGGSEHHLLTANGFSKPQASSALADGRSLAVNTNAAVTQMSDELVSVCPPASCGPEPTTVNAGGKSHSGSIAGDSARGVDGEGSNSKKNSQAGGSSHKAPSAQLKNPSGRHHGHYQRGGAQKNQSGTEWPNRKMGFHGRSHSSGGERGFPPNKVKQIYVAKQSTSGITKAVES